MPTDSSATFQMRYSQTVPPMLSRLFSRESIVKQRNPYSKVITFKFLANMKKNH